MLSVKRSGNNPQTQTNCEVIPAVDILSRAHVIIQGIYFHVIEKTVKYRKYFLLFSGICDKISWYYEFGGHFSYERS